MFKFKGTGCHAGIVIALVLVLAGSVAAASQKPTTVAELALYRGADRQQILEEGAKKEGKLLFYTTGILTQSVRPAVDAFQRKYPHIKVEIWRGDSNTLLSRIHEEHRAGKLLADVIEGTQMPSIILQKEGILQAFYSPNLAYIKESAVAKAPGETAWAGGFREMGLVLGYNTKLITKEQLPKTYQDLLNPKWKGKSAVAGSETLTYWVGTMLSSFGEDFVKKMAAQQFTVHMVSARALLDMVINGEYAFTPTIYDAQVTNSKGAPLGWVGLEPVHVNLGQIMLPKNSAHPHAALLFIDFELSREAGEIIKAIGYNSTRKDVPGTPTYKRFYGAETAEEAVKWNDITKRLFLKR